MHSSADCCGEEDLVLRYDDAKGMFLTTVYRSSDVNEEKSILGKDCIPRCATVKTS